MKERILHTTVVGAPILYSPEYTQEQLPSHMIFQDDDKDEEISSKKRRLASDQVRALEQSFDVENRLEPDRKARLAQALGLQPRQVAVWFQNRRARFKTKNLERDFSALKSRYDALRLSFDSLRRDNEALAAQLAALKAERQQPHDKPLGLVDVIKGDEDWEDNYCGAEIFSDEYGATLAWFSAEIAAAGDCSGWES